MRIGMLTGEYPPMPGGIADYTAILAREMSVQGHDLFILTNPAAEKSPSLRAGRGWGGVSEGKIHVSPTISNWNRAFFGAVKRWTAENRLDILNLQYQTAAFNMSGLLHFLPSRLKTPFVTTFHDLRFPYLFPKAGVVRPWIVRELARRSDGVLVTNRGDERELQKLGLPHLARIPLGSTVNVVSAAGGMSGVSRADVRRRIGAGDAFVIAHFGFVNAVKGVDTLLRAGKIARDNGVPVFILMIGERVGASDPTNFAYAQSIDALAAELDITPHWTGFADDAALADYFAAADVVALPFKDGASLRRTSLQAALAYGCAIITTYPTDDDLPEFTDGDNLLYVPIDDADALAEAVKRLYEHPDWREKLRAGAQTAAGQFRWQDIAARVLAFYERVMP